MTAVARMAMLNLRTVAPYRVQGLLLFALGALVFANRPTLLVPALVFFVTAQLAPHPFNVADKTGLETLYAVLPLPRRAVLCGHYVWAAVLFFVTTSASAVLAVVFARVQHVSFTGHTFVTVLTVSWALFAVNVAIQFPLLIRFGYTRANVLGTAMPLAAIMGAVYRLHLKMPSTGVWLPVFWMVGAAVLVASALVAIAVDSRR